MGLLPEQAAQRSEMLTDYYLNALQFIDPALTVDSPMDDIIGAAARKQRQLRIQAGANTEEQLTQLTDAVMFIQRLRRSRAS